MPAGLATATCVWLWLFSAAGGDAQGRILPCCAPARHLGDQREWGRGQPRSLGPPPRLGEQGLPQPCLSPASLQPRAQRPGTATPISHGSRGNARRSGGRQHYKWQQVWESSAPVLPPSLRFPELGLFIYFLAFFSRCHGCSLLLEGFLVFQPQYSQEPHHISQNSS